MPVRLALLGAVGIAAIASITWLVAHNVDRSQRADLVMQARIVASMLHREHFASLTGTAADLVDPNYALLKESLTRAREASSRYRFIYVMGLSDDGRPFFYADSEPAESPHYSPPGQAYDGASSKFLSAFRSGEAGTEGPLSDAWGRWISAFVPLIERADGSFAVLGMDVDARLWFWSVAGRAALPGSALLAAFLFGLLALRLARARRDVEAREIMLRESLQTSRDLVRAIPSGLYLFQHAPPDRLLLIDGNVEAARLTGVASAALLGKEFDDVWRHESGRAVKSRCLEALRTGEVYESESVLFGEAPDQKTLRFRSFALPGGRLAVAFEDVTARIAAEARVRHLLEESNAARQALLGILEDEKRAEDSLRRSEEKFAAAFRTSPYALAMTRIRDGRFLEVNDAFAVISGYSRDEAMANSSATLRLWIDEQERQRVVHDLTQGQAVVGREFLFRHKSGQILTGLFSAQIIMLGDEPCVLASIDDITQRRRAEAESQRLQDQLAQSQKMEYVGRLAGGIAHDFNNLLMGIMNYVELCRDRIHADHPIRGWLDEIARDAQRSADLTRQLLGFARRQTIAPCLLDLNVAVPATLRMLRRLIGEDIDIVWRPGTEAMSVKIDPSQLDQVLVNLAVNARDAIGGAGRLTLETMRTPVGGRRALAADVPAGEYVELVVTDNGSGMSRETLDHIFEPFFTTKLDGEGTGLGLATVYGIVRQNGGFIEVVSTLGQGTTFRVALPLASGEPKLAADERSGSDGLGGSETILVVEDEKSVRVTIEWFLRDLGYTVLVAETAAAALECSGRHPGDIALLITDVVMPRMSGRALCELLVQRRPGLHCLYISGYTADVIASRGIIGADVDFLAKPFTRDELARKVRAILDR